jgi:AraC-like DNA-binding protein
MGSRNVRTDPAGIERLHALGHSELLVPPELRGALPAYLHSAGFHELPRLSPWQGQHRSVAEMAILLHTVAGHGRLRNGGQDLVIAPGQTALLCNSREHPHGVADDDRWEFFHVTLGGPSAIHGVREAAARLGTVVRFAVESPVISRLADTCADVLAGTLGSAFLASSTAYGLVMTLLGDRTAEPAVEEPHLNRLPEFVSAVERFCQANLNRPIGVNDMARVARMSRFHFTRMFEKARGISPGRYLASLRLEESLRLITRGTQSVKVVAEACGYGDANYFCKVFRRSFGVSPGAFRAGLAQGRPRSAPPDR